MDIEEVDWSTELDGENFELPVYDFYLNGCHWKCKDGKPKYVIVYMHGLCSSLCFNANVLRVFTDHGGAAIGTDHKGHGISIGHRTEVTVFELVEEVSQLVSYAKIRYPNTPIFVLGHSLGGLTTLLFAMSHRTTVELINGVIVTGPWLKAARFPNPSLVLRSAIKFAAHFLPHIGIPTGLDVSKSTYPQGYKDAVQASKYMLTKGSPVIFNSVLKAMFWINDDQNLYPDDVPILFMQGTGDKLVDVKTNINWATNLVKRIGDDKATFIEYEDAPHDIMKCQYRKDAFENMFKFIEKNSK